MEIKLSAAGQGVYTIKINDKPKGYNAVNMKTANVKTWGITTQACAEPDGTVRVFDPISGYFTTCHELTAAQLRHVRRVATN